LRAHAFDVIHQPDRHAEFIEVFIDFIGLRLTYGNQHAHAAQAGFVAHAGHQEVLQLAPQHHERGRLQRRARFQALAESRPDADRDNIGHEVQQGFVDLLLKRVGDGAVSAQFPDS